jgi:hypothetical protein
MKVIDILNKRANNEEIPKKIKYADDIYVLYNYTDAIERLYVWENDSDIGWFEREYFTVHSEVEVIEEDPIEKLRKDVEELNKKLDEHVKDLFSHNGAPLTISTGIEDKPMKFGDYLTIKHDNGTSFVFDKEGVSIREDR